MNRRLVILGTASQVPTIYRNHLSFFLRWDKEGFLFDPGEGTQRQLIFNNISASEITKIFISHFHGDHCLGLPGIIQRLSLDNVNHTVTIFYPSSGKKYLNNLLNCAIFYNKAKIVCIPLIKAGIVYEDQDLSIEVHPLDHGIDTWGFCLKEKDKRTILPHKLPIGLKKEKIGKLKKKGYVYIDDKKILLEEVSRLKKGQKFAYIADTKICPQVFEIAKDADLLVCESTYAETEKELAKKYNHLTAKQAAYIAKTSNVHKLVLVHFSQRYFSLDILLNEAKEEFDNVIVAKDGDIIEIPRIKRNMS